MSGHLAHVCMVGRELLVLFVVVIFPSLVDQRKGKLCHTIAPLTAKSRFKMFFAGTSPRYIDADIGASPGMSGESARLA
jgi:hypothetical protein